MILLKINYRALRSSKKKSSNFKLQTLIHPHVNESLSHCEGRSNLIELTKNIMLHHRVDGDYEKKSVHMKFDLRQTHRLKNIFSFPEKSASFKSLFLSSFSLS